jgi:hypothetical protein
MAEEPTDFIILQNLPPHLSGLRGIVEPAGVSWDAAMQQCWYPVGAVDRLLIRDPDALSIVPAAHAEAWDHDFKVALKHTRRC